MMPASMAMRATQTACVGSSRLRRSSQHATASRPRGPGPASAMRVDRERPEVDARMNEQLHSVSQKSVAHDSKALERLVTS